MAYVDMARFVARRLSEIDKRVPEKIRQELVKLVSEYTGTIRRIPPVHELFELPYEPYPEGTNFRRYVE